MVWVNCYKRVNPGSPFGGVGRSGYGREMGFEAMREYTEPKSVWVNVDAAAPAVVPEVSELMAEHRHAAARRSPASSTTATWWRWRASPTSSPSPPATS